MTHVVERNGRFRASIMVNTKRHSATFDTKLEAETWAARLMSVEKRKRALRKAYSEAAVLSFLPKRVADAICSLPFTAEDVVAGSMPITDTCGVYFLIKDREVVYVGQSIDVLGRISKHRRMGRDFDSFNFVACAREDLDKTEADYITAFMPLWNRAFGNVA